MSLYSIAGGLGFDHLLVHLFWPLGGLFALQHATNYLWQLTNPPGVL